MAAELITIDVHDVVARRLPGGRFVPRWLTRPLERLIRQDEMNTLLRRLHGLEGADFCRGVMQELDFSCEVVNAGRLPDPDDRRVIYVSNHPLGGLDGMALIDLLTRHHRSPLHFVVNDLLSAVAPLRSVFVPINKHGRQGRDAARRLDSVFDGPGPVIVFPAGLVSRKSADGGIMDLEWHKMFVTKALATGRDVIPLYFDAHNSRLFYNFAHLRSRLGLKFNYEMVLLPSEVFKSRGARARVVVGSRIPCDMLRRSGADARDVARDIRSMVYALRADLKNQPTQPTTNFGTAENNR